MERPSAGSSKAETPRPRRRTGPPGPAAARRPVRVPWSYRSSQARRGRRRAPSGAHPPRAPSLAGAAPSRAPVRAAKSSPGRPGAAAPIQASAAPSGREGERLDARPPAWPAPRRRPSQSSAPVRPAGWCRRRPRPRPARSRAVPAATGPGPRQVGAERDEPAARRGRPPRQHRHRPPLQRRRGHREGGDALGARHGAGRAVLAHHDAAPPRATARSAPPPGRKPAKVTPSATVRATPSRTSTSVPAPVAWS